MSMSLAKLLWMSLALQHPLPMSSGSTALQFTCWPSCLAIEIAHKYLRKKEQRPRLTDSVQIPFLQSSKEVRLC